jgi:hypothetical protein
MEQVLTIPAPAEVRQRILERREEIARLKKLLKLSVAASEAREALKQIPQTKGGSANV